MKTKMASPGNEVSLKFDLQWESHQGSFARLPLSVATYALIFVSVCMSTALLLSTEGISHHARP